MPTDPASGYSDAERVPAYILAGGRSRRFGSDKARAVVDGSPNIVTIARTIEPFVSSVSVVAARRAQYEDLGLRTIADVVPDRGPMGGLLTAIDDVREGWLLLLACDWVGIRGAWVGNLLRARAPGAQAVSFHTVRFEPMFAIYHVDIRLTVVDRIERSELAMQSLLEDAEMVRLPLPAGWASAVNQNVPPRRK